MKLFNKKKKSSSYMPLFIGALVILGIYIAWKLKESNNKIAKLETKVQYNNEKVLIERDDRGRIAGMIVNRTAH